MKKIILAAISLLMVNSTQAQLYFGLQSSYNKGVQGRTLADYLLVDGTFSSIGTGDLFVDKRSSFGGGIKMGAVVGYQLNEYLGAELNANYHSTNKISTKTTEGSNVSKVSLQGDVVSINPALVGYLYNGIHNVYAKCGMVYNTGNFLLDHEETGNEGKNSFSFTINEGYALGWNFSVGATWKVKKNLHLRTELDYVYANYYPQKATLTSLVEDGVDQMPKINVKEYEITYAKTGHTEGEYYGSAIGNGILVRPQIPMGGVGLNVGLIYSFKKINKSK